MEIENLVFFQPIGEIGDITVPGALAKELCQKHWRRCDNEIDLRFDFCS